ncbi:sigma-E factor negative regulatory protein [Noviherbaspirillum saxi]|nr:sigma-E factor negative regulatory protein [Noviherbaspirillum saxi]
MTREHISALADGELADQQLDAALAELRDDDAQSDWAIYHQIGDLLRSDDMAVNISADFGARLAARLDAEPTIIAPAALNAQTQADSAEKAENLSNTSHGNMKSTRKRWALPGMVAAAAMATVAFVATPQLMVALKGSSGSAEGTNLASRDPSINAQANGATAVMTSSANGEIIMRDARIDDYLFAHQRFSPSVYSTAQYARSATFATDSTK